MRVQPVNERTTDATALSVPAPRREFPATAELRLQVTYGPRGGALVNVEGEVDVCSAPRLHELLQCRLRSALHTLVVNLTGVTFMSIEGAWVLEYAANYARCHNKDIRIDVGGSRAVARVLRATGLRSRLPLSMAE